MNTAGNRCCKGTVRNVLCAALCVALYANVPAAHAQSTASIESIRQYDIPAGSLSGALGAWGAQSDRQVVFAPDLVTGKQTKGASGQYGAEQALTRLLAGTGLAWKRVNGQTYALEKAPPPQPVNTNQKPASKSKSSSSAAAQKVTQLSAVTVTGSHIRGAPPSSPVIDISQEQMIQAGQTDLGEVIRSIPQNFSGGQNPGVALGTGGINNQNMTGGSGLNLRGLGADASLTLLNGRRLSFDGFGQAVDITQVPLAAVDRIEIVADGASAIYGSDAVAGVANVILKRDYEGLSTSARFGGATSGGDFQQQYSVVGGTRWSTGGFIATTNYEKSTDIGATQRSYTHYIAPPYTLLPDRTGQSALFSAHQQLGEFAEFKVDALYNKHDSQARYNQVSVQAGIKRITNQYTIAPELTFHLPDDWTLSLNGVYGRDKGVVDQAAYLPDGTLYAAGKTCYCNTIKGWEVDAGGPWVHLPGGDARVALGVGYRESVYRDDDLSDPTQPSQGGEQHSYYAFGEIYLPLISPGSGLSFAHELSINAALRREQYNTFGAVTTPKIGVIYAPTADFDLKASWGKSFKTPTLLQQRQPFAVYLYNARAMGATGYPGMATALMTWGGDPDLEPERARTWTATLGIHPASLPGFHADFSYFDVNYDQRVAQGIINRAAALADPAYRDFINSNPTLEQIQQLVDEAGSNFNNFAGVPYDPANVIAIINDQYVNIASWRVHGLDLSAGYDFEWGSNSVSLTGSASWLKSQQRNSSLSPAMDLAGTMYNPPNWHSRLGATWQRGPFILSAYYNYIGGVTDTTNHVDGEAMQTIDLTGVYHFQANFDVLVSVKNLTNQRPPYLRNLYPFMVNFDSTNYSPIGRYVGITLTKKWF